MNLKMLKQDFQKNLWKNLILFLFICLSAMIAVTVTLTLAQLFTSISSMYETANPPHFLQMHEGDVSQDDLDDFNSSYSGITHWQTIPMINVYGEELCVSNETGKQFTLSDCRLDISLVRQNDEYDVLLDENRDRLEMQEGRIGVPVILLDQFDIEIGDIVTLNSKGMVKEFIVSDYVYDGQMNSTLCSSTRFLISDADFSTMSGNVGETEYLIEAWFADSGQAADYQTAYEQSDKNLPKNGQAITYTMIFLLSALTDLLMAVVFLLAGILLMIIALVCLRYAVLAELEEDMREIGTMKAMGIPEKGIRNLYLGKIRVLTAAGCGIGFLLGFFMTALITGHISRTFGNQSFGSMSICMAVLTAAAVYGIILIFSKKILRRLKKAGVIDLMVTEKGFGRGTAAHDGLRRSKKLPVSLLIGLYEVRHGYGIVFGLLLIVSFLIVIPIRTVQTMENREFVTYMGSAECDLLVEAGQGENLEARRALAEKVLLEEAEQGAIQNVDTLRRVRLQAVRSDGEVIGIHIDTGRSAGAGLKYLDGKNPASDTEIALSYLMADELGKSVGDAVDILVSGEKRRFIVCGIYQDVTSGGRTAKTCSGFPEEQAEKYEFALTLSQGNADNLAFRLRKKLGSGYSIENMEEFLGQTLGGVTAQVRQAERAVLWIGICLTVLITALFLRLRIARYAAALSAKKAIGIPFAEIWKQELYPVLLAGGFGSVCGIVLAELSGDRLISALFQMLGMGLKRIVFVKVSAGQFIMIPAILLVTLTVVVSGVCMKIRKMNVSDYVNE